MPVVGLSLTKMEAKRKVPGMIRGVKVNNNTKITSVEEKTLPGLEKQGLVIKFEYESEYKTDSQEVGEIEIGGEVLFIDNDHGKIVEGWKADKKLPDTVNLQVVNSILKKCITKAIMLSDELNLPAPIALPYASKKKPEESRYIG